MEISLLFTLPVEVALLLDKCLQHPDICWDNEIIRRIKFCTDSVQQKPKIYIIYRMYANNYKYYGFETTNYQLGEGFLNVELQDYINILKNLGVTYFINLQRKNYLRKNISNLIGRKTRKFQSKSKNATLTKIKIEINNNKNNENTLINYYENFDKYYNKIDGLLEKENSLKLIYEDDILHDPHIAYNKIINFIGLDNFTPEITLRK